MSSRDEIEVVGTFVTETDKAYLVDVDGEEIWLPKSQVSADGDIFSKGDEITLNVPEWLAEEKGLA